MRLSDGWMIFVILAFTMYILLDGYDLGIGVLTLVVRDPARRRELHQLVAWTWDGNESWLVLIALTLWGGLPVVSGVALPAVYLPVMLMLFSLIARGVSLEMIEQHPGWHRVWGNVFAVGSFLVAFCQGAAFGGLVAGVSERSNTFTGGPLDFLHDGYAILTGLTAVSLYVLAGSAWAYLRADPGTRRLAARSGRVAVLTVGAGTAACWLLAPVAGSVTLHAGDAARLPMWVAGSALLAAGLAAAASLFRVDHQGAGGWGPVYATLTVYAGGLLLAGGLLYPTLVPPNITVHSAASPNSSLLFLLIGVGIFVPIILTYQGYGYWVFRLGRGPKLEEPLA
jgi:cytochrome bd ubiquinol oxidase subunit II